MSYNVLIIADIYRSHPLYEEWMKHHYDGSYFGYLKEFHPEVFEYVEYIHDDQMFYEIDENLYNAIEFINENAYKMKRCRVFAFHSKAHYTWFKLRW